MFDVCMGMWGKLFSKRGPPKWPCILVNREICDFLAKEDNIILDLVYVGMDWRGFPNILFTIVEPLDERGNIIIMF